MEVPLAGSEATKWTKVSVPRLGSRPAAPCSCPPPHNAAGSALVPSRSNRTRDCFIFWRFDKDSPSVMEILQLSSQQSFPCQGLRLCFEEALCPFASIYPIEVNDGQGLHFHVTVVAASGIVYRVHLPVSGELWNNLLLPASTVSVRDLSPSLAGLQQVTKFVATTNMLFAGGQNGSVLCFSLLADTDVAYELKGDAGLSRLWGFVSRNKTVGEVQSLAVEETGSKVILFVLYADGGLQAWDALRHVRLFSQNLCSIPELAGSAAKRMWLEEGILGPSKHLAVLFEKLDSGQEVICLYDIDALPSSSGGVLRQAISVEQGKVVEVKLLEGDLWVLKETVDNGYDLTHFKLQLGVLPQSFHLLEEELCSRLIFEEHPHLRELLRILAGESLLRKLYLRRLLQPGILHVEVLQDVLRSWGVGIHESDATLFSTDEWGKKIVVALQTEGADDSLIRWNRFSVDYVSSWRQKNYPCALFSDIRTGCMGLLRKSSVSLFRLHSSVEKTANAVREEEDSHTLESLLRCMRELTSQLGSLPLALFQESLLDHRSGSLDQLLSAYLRILDVGYQANFEDSAQTLGLDEFRRRERELHRKQRKFNFRIFSAVREIKNKAGSWDIIIDSVVTYSKLVLEFGSHHSVQKVCNVSSSAGLTKLISMTTSQVLLAHFEAARNLVLLLSFFIKVKGQIDLSGSEAASIQHKLLPELKRAMIINLVLHLLSTTSLDAPRSEDFSSLLSALRIDGSTADAVRTNNVPCTLFEILTSSFLAAAPVTFSQQSGPLVEKGDLLDYSKSFITWLIIGQDGKKVAFSQRVIDFSSILLRFGQYRGLQEFLAIVEKFSNERHLNESIKLDGGSSARLHLLGFCLLARACSSETLDEPTKDQLITEANSCFFRAAAGIDDTSEALRPLFSRAVSLPGAAWKYQYYEWIMQIFEQHNLSGGAMEFALAALNQVQDDNMYIDNIVGVKGRLWANVFKFAMDLSLYGDAYCAIVSNPDEESRHTCLRRFVVVLCEQKAAEILCGGELPYVALLETVEQELAWKAEYSDISNKPNAYKLLYAFHIRRHNYRRSAGYIYRYTMRVKDEGVSKSRLPLSVALQEQVNGLGAAIGALSLVSPAYAWLDGQFTGFEELAWSSPSKRGRPSLETQVHRPGQKLREEHVLDIDALEKQYAIAVAKLELVKAKVEHPRLGELLPAEVVHLLVQSGLYDIAFSMVFKLWQDSALKSELEKVFELMARQCCAPLTMRRDQKLLLSGPFQGIEEKESLGGSRSSWQALQSNLEKHRRLHPRLPVVVAEAILSTNKHMELPLWLVDMLKGGKSASPLGMAGQEADPAALLRVYLDSGRLVEASSLLLEYLKASVNMRPLDVIKRKRMSSTWLPYTSVVRLQAALAEARDRDPQMRELERSVLEAVKNHLNQMKEDSRDVSLGKAGNDRPLDVEQLKRDFGVSG